MLPVKQNAGRTVMDLNGIWNFQLDDGTQYKEDAMPGILASPDPIAVPASYNDQKDSMAYRDHYGWAFYQRTVTAPAALKGQRLWLRFEAVVHTAKVWLNGRLVCTHIGGFLPFETEITDILPAGSSALLTVAVNNSISHSTLPVGHDPDVAAVWNTPSQSIFSLEQASRSSKLQNRPNFDFFNYAGISRPVWLYTTPVNYIKDVTVCGSTDGRVTYHVDTEGEGKISFAVLDAEGKEIAAAVGSEGTVQLPDPKLWWPWPKTPYLYTAHITFGEDSYDQAFGLRSVEVQGTQFLINGEPFYFKGFGKHEDSYFHGRGLDNCLNVKDINLIHWLGANSFRTSHYPYAQEMYDLCDQQGIVIIDETPAVGLNMGTSANPYEFGTMAHHKQVLNDLIARDKNHPSVVMWSLGNEPDLENFPRSAYEYWHDLYELAHAADPQNRPVTIACCLNDYTKDITTPAMDVICLNRYYGWYNLSGDLDAACHAWNLELDFWEKLGKPVMLTEYGADTINGFHQTVPVMFSEEFQKEYYHRINAECDKRSFFIGEHVWNFADFATVQGVRRVDGNRKGLFTRDRAPKMAAHHLRERWNKIPNFHYK